MPTSSPQYEPNLLLLLLVTTMMRMMMKMLAVIARCR